MAPQNVSDEAGAVSRSARLARFFDIVLRGKRALHGSNDGNLFLEAICSQVDHANCIEKLAASAEGLNSLRKALRFDCESAPFLNGFGTSFIRYLAEDPTVKEMLGGKLLQRVLIVVVDPPTVWNALTESHEAGRLDENAEFALAWLLLELVSWSDNQPTDFFHIAKQKVTEQNKFCLLRAASRETRAIGRKLHHALQAPSVKGIGSTDSGPGGRHDNDFADFRQIAILPTADEIHSPERPFYRLANAIESVEDEDRSSVHLDNQFRLLREDLLGELRGDLQIALGQRKGKRSGFVIPGLSLEGIYCGNESRRQQCALSLRCNVDFPQLAGLNSSQRRAFLKANFHFLKDRSLGCLLNGKEIVAFANLERNEELLAKAPPIINFQISDKTALSKAILTSKISKNLQFVPVMTAVFAYEPILRCLQQKNDLSLGRELLATRRDTTPQMSSFSLVPMIDILEAASSQDLQSILNTPAGKPIKLDDSQARSLRTGLTQALSLIQGPPGTGKSFIGALLAKILHDKTKESILVMCFTNHALDQFLEDLMDIGISAESMVRLGSKFTTRTEPISLSKQYKSSNFKRSQGSWNMINKSKDETESSWHDLSASADAFRDTTMTVKDSLEYLEFSEEPQFYQALTISGQEETDSEGMKKVDRLHKVGPSYLWDRWVRGKHAGRLRDRVSSADQPVWQMEASARTACVARWQQDILKEQLIGLQDHVEKINSHQRDISAIFGEKTTEILKRKRIIGCTTTAAAMYANDLQKAAPGIILVEEAGEILESHVLGALAPSTKQVILIGDHLQLRPKINNYSLTVEKRDGYNLNMSMFERLVQSGYPHTTLLEQHRMSPEISSLVRQLTYPDLMDSPRTKKRSPLRGFEKRVIFVDHQEPEANASEIADRRDQGAASSKRNLFEVEMVLKCVRYLGQQGYGTDRIVVLTPYVGQLLQLRNRLSEENDPILNDLDSFDLVQAGLLPAASAKQAKRPIRLSTIDNYQGEESDIVIGSLTRSNSLCEIGFMSAPQRLNVLLSRARDALILIGNVSTYKGCRKGKETWVKFFDQLQTGGNIFNGFPVKCERHPDRKTIISEPQGFEQECPDGGCLKPCGAKLNCNLHYCPQKCHQLQDHSKVACRQILKESCSRGHQMSWECYRKRPATCRKCDEDQKIREKKQKRDHDLEVRRDLKQKQYAQKLADLDDEIDSKRRLLKEQIEQETRQAVIAQRHRELADLQQSVERLRLSGSPNSNIETNAAKHPTNPPAEHSPASSTPSSNQSPSHEQHKATNDQQEARAHDHRSVEPPHSKALDDWNFQEQFENSRNDALDSLMNMTGLEEIKQQFLAIKAKIDTATRQNTDLKQERFGAALLGNPGTGKTTIARLYGSFLASVGALPGTLFVESSGSSLAHDGIAGCKKKIEQVLEGGGGAMFIDEAYQLVSANNFGGSQVLDYLLTEMENLTGKVVFILAGYNKQMEAFFAHNPGIPSRIPIQFQFEDYDDTQLLDILCKLIEAKYKKRMKVEGGLRGLYMRIICRRLESGRGREGFGNARAVQNCFAKITDRQAKRISKERRAKRTPDDNLFTKEDLIGPNPAEELRNNQSWKQLQKLIGLKSVKESVEALFNQIEFNYHRELEGKPPITCSLNRVLLGSPGTGKTTVAKLYGRILADLGLLSNGKVVVKNPADFIGSVIGESEKNTKAILANTVGKVLVIDEAYMLSSGDSSVDSYKTAIVDTIVAEVQSTAAEDRCVLLVGYKDQMEKMFQNVNPGLSRRFPLGSAFVFEDFSDDELKQILRLKLREQGFKVTNEAETAAIDVLRRARNRPHFGNAGEVDILLDRAKTSHLSKKSRTPDTLEAHDFDSDFDRARNAPTNCRKLFEGVLGCDKVISQLEGYQRTVATMKSLDMDPAEQIPFNFLFRGPPGTGKTSTARKMGKVFYDMGFLATAEVIECSATDLVGQYVGHTGPRTQQVLEKALGKVLFIDEAYRLAEGHFATEAMDEITDCLTKPKFFRKLIVILAGYDEDINRLMSINPGLTSRFPETVVFNAFTPSECLDLMATLLQKKMKLNSSVLRPLSADAAEVYMDLFSKLILSPSWANARDVEELVKNIWGSILKSAETPKPALVLRHEDITSALKTMLSERKHRARNVANGRASPDHLPKPRQQNEAKGDQESKASRSEAQRTDRDPSAPAQEPANTQQTPDTVPRDPGVSNEIWLNLQLDKQMVVAREKAFTDLVEQEKNVNQTIALATATIEEEETHDHEDEEEKRRRERERIERVRALRAKQEELETLQRERERAQEERRKEEVAQTRLRRMGVCVAGFRWIKQAGGYRCAGGSHWVSDAELGMG